MKTIRSILSLCVLASAAMAWPCAAADGTWLTLNGTTPWSTTSNWSGGTVADGVNSTALFTANIDGALDVTLNDVGRTIGNITFTDSTTDSHNMTISGSNALTLDRSSGAPVIIVSSANRTLTISSVVAGTDGLNKGGPGTLVLDNPSNSYTGATSISEGTLSISSIGNVGGGNSAIGAPTTEATGRIVMGIGNLNGILRYTGGAQSTDRTIQVSSSTNGNNGGAAIINDGTGALTFTAAAFNNPYGNTNANTRLLTLGGTNGGTIQGAIVDISGTMLVGFTKTGTGTWVTSGANTFTGASNFFGGGTMTLDYATQNNSKLSDAAGLTLSGTGLTLQGGSHTEVVSATTLGGGGTTVTQSGGSSTIRLNAITRQDGSTIRFSAPSIADTDTTNVNGILGGWATIGNDWAINSTNGADGAITALASYTGALPTSTGDATANYTLNGNQTQTASTSAFTVKLTGTGSGDTLALGNTTLAIATPSTTELGGILYVGGGDNVYNITSTSGNGLNASATQNLIINTVTGTLNVSATINGSGSTRSFVKAGAGTLVVSSANAYTGTVRVNEGVLRVANATATGTDAGGIIVQNGAALELANSVAVGAEALTITGMGVSNAGALRNIASNTSSYAGAVTIGTGGARVNSDSGGSLTLTGGVVTSLFNDVAFGGAGNTTVSTAAISGAGGLVKDGDGVLNLNVGSTYAGPTTVSGGTLFVNNGSGSATGTGLVALASGTTLGGNGTIGGSVAVSGGTISPGNSPGTLAIGGALALDSLSLLDFELNASDQTVGGGINDLITLGSDLILDGTLDVTSSPLSTGTWRLFNYSGNLTNNGLTLGSISLAPSHSASIETSVLGQINLVVVPEPETIVLLGAGVAMLCVQLVRRRQASARDRV
jgi:autotransporter-associated beta strand protein